MQILQDIISKLYNYTLINKFQVILFPLLVRCKISVVKVSNIRVKDFHGYIAHDSAMV